MGTAVSGMDGDGDDLETSRGDRDGDEFRGRSSKVIDFGRIRKRVCDFLLVRHNNLGTTSHRFGDIAGFLLRN